MRETWTCPGCGDGPYVDDPYGIRAHVNNCDSVDGGGNARPVYEVIVGNIGTVYRGTDRSDAFHCYNSYVMLSVDEVGRAAGESVCLMEDGEPIKEHEGAMSIGEYGYSFGRVGLSDEEE